MLIIDQPQIAAVITPIDEWMETAPNCMQQSPSLMPMATPMQHSF